MPSPSRRWWRSLAAPIVVLLLTSPGTGDTPRAAPAVPAPTPTWEPLPAQLPEDPQLVRAAEDEAIDVRVLLAEGRRAASLSGEGLWWAGADGLRHAVDGQARVAVERGALRMGSQRLPSTVTFGTADGRTRLDGRSWPGKVRLRLVRTRIEVVNVVGLEAYVAGVVAAETPPHWGEDVKRAQAVVVRSYTLASLQKTRRQSHDIGISSLEQLYQGHRVDAAARRAVEATRGRVLRAGSRVVTAYYHASCGGRTEPARGLSAESAGVRGVVDPWCARAPAASWSTDVGAGELGELLAARGLGDGSPVSSLGVARRSATGQASKVVAGTGSGEVELAATDFRFLVGPVRVKSTRFSIRPEGDGFHVHGRGFGHSSGLCQWGAWAQTQAGRTAEQVLAFYFPGARVEALDPWQASLARR